MTETQTVPADELEEVFDHDIMCGGNGLKATTCSNSNRAVVKLEKPCCYFPQIFKCIPCYTQWLETRHGKTCRCACGKVYYDPRYVPI